MQSSNQILVCVLAASLFYTAPIAAKTVTVNCNEGMTVSNSLNQLKPFDANTVRVMGTCHESIYIGNFAQLSIIGVDSESGHAVMKGITGSITFWIVGSHVQLTNLIMDGGLFGVMCRDFSVCRFRGNTIENNTSNGVVVDNADATFSGDLIQNNKDNGLNLTASRVRLSQVTVKGTTAGSSGPGHGVDIQSGSTVTVDGLTAEQNQGAGISLSGNSHLDNQFWAGTLTVSNNATGGIWITELSTGFLSGAIVINNTGAAGVVITENSEAAFWGGGTFTGNNPADVYCGPLNGIAAAPQLANIGFTNCPNTF
jgi:hypothetical protein